MKLVLTDEQPSPEERAFMLPPNQTEHLGLYGIVVENNSRSPIFLIPDDPQWSPAGMARV